MTCPHCGVPLIDHVDVNTKGGDAFHCNTCGCCFNADGDPRSGHPDCGKPAIHPFAPPKKVEPKTESEPKAESKEGDKKAA